MHGTWGVRLMLSHMCNLDAIPFIFQFRHLHPGPLLTTISRRDDRIGSAKGVENRRRELARRSVQNKTAGPPRAPAILKIGNQARACGLGVRLRFAEAEDTVPFLPLATTLENFHPLEALENVALRRDGAGTFETAMLGHKILEKRRGS